MYIEYKLVNIQLGKSYAPVYQYSTSCSRGAPYMYTFIFK